MKTIWTRPCASHEKFPSCKNERAAKKKQHKVETQMIHRPLSGFLLGLIVCLCAGALACAPNSTPEIAPELNQALQEFLRRNEKHPGRKIAVFDGDGTVFGQTPHYLADECMFEFAAQRPDRKPGMLATLRKQSNVSLPYVQGRVKFFAGESLTNLRDLGRDCFRRHYQNKVFPPVRYMIRALQAAQFEVWIVTASPEALYQGFLSDTFDIPITRIVGVKSEIHNGIVTEQIVFPVPQDEGKTRAIETFVQDRPLFVAGNSRGDKEMIEFSSDLKLIVNPDVHIAPGQVMSIAEHAKRQGWLVIRTPDIAAADHPRISSKRFGTRLNREHSGTPRETR